MFSKMIERLSDNIGGKRVEALAESTMPLDAEIVTLGGQVGEEHSLGHSLRSGSKERRRSRRSPSTKQPPPPSPRRAGNGPAWVGRLRTRLRLPPQRPTTDRATTAGLARQANEDRYRPEAEEARHQADRELMTKIGQGFGGYLLRGVPAGVSTDNTKDSARLGIRGLR